MKPSLLTIIGPTACGKTALAVQVAHRLGTAVISGDSRQVYRRMDIGTGKDLAEYVVDGCPVPYHLIDICDPGEQYNLFRYQHDFHQVYAALRAQGKLPVLCGGTGMYIEAVLKGYRLLNVPQNPNLRAALQGKSLPELETLLRQFKTLHNKTDVDSVQRAIRAIEIETYYRTQAPEVQAYEPIDSLIVALDMPRKLRRQRITERLHTRLQAGMIEEARQLLNEGIPAENLLYYGLEYRYLTRYLLGQLSYEQLCSELEIAIHQFAKRQMTWLRGMERRGFTLHWLDATLPLPEQIRHIEQWLMV